MSSYTAVRRELQAGTSPDVLCATCPWDRLCVQPPSMTRQEIDRQIDEAKQKDAKEDSDKMPVGALLTAVMIGGRDTTGQMCPVFALRLRGPDGRQLADGIRALMREETS